MNNIEKVKELIAAKLSKDIEFYNGNALGEERVRKKALETQAAYDNRGRAIRWAEDILAQFNFTFDGIGEEGLYYSRAGGEHTREMVVYLHYGRSRRPWTPSFRADTDKTNRRYAIKNNFAKQIGRRIEERDSIEKHFAGLKSYAYQQQADVKAAFAKAKAAVNSVWSLKHGSKIRITSLKSEIVNDRHVFSMDFAGRDIPLSYVNYHSAEFEQGSLLVTVEFSAGGPREGKHSSRIEKTMLLKEFLESELIYRIYFNDALA